MEKERKCGDDEALIESSCFTTSSSSSSSKFGSFILLVLVNKCLPKTHHPSRQHSLIRLSSSESGVSVSGGWKWWSNDRNDGPDNYEDQVFKVDTNNNNLGGSSNDQPQQQQQQQQQLVLRLDSLGIPSCYESSYFFKQFGGACDGLVCLYDFESNKVSLWNPATKQHRVLPRPIKIRGDCPHDLIAFGFDVETKDYKVVLLTGFRQVFYKPVSPIECLCRVQVYSLSTDSWRLLDGLTCLPGDPFGCPGGEPPDVGRYLNGSCFFLARFLHTKPLPCFPENDRFIISFDLTKEIITPIQLPDHHRDQKLYLSYMGDSLALFTKVCHNGYEDFNIWVLNGHNSSSSSSMNKESWVLKQHGSSSSMKKEPWTKLHSFQIEVETQTHEENIPRGISDDGEFALLENTDTRPRGKRMKLYHCVSKEVKRNFLTCSNVMSIANAYKPSLVSVIGGNDATNL